MKLIKKKDIVEFLENQLKTTDNTETLCYIQATLCHIETLDISSDEWISVEDRLPEDDVTKDRKAIDVLVTTKGGRVSKVQRIKNTFNKTNPYWYWGRISCDVIAWKPLPKAYKK